MALKVEGIWPCVVLDANYGEDSDPRNAGLMQAQINVLIDAGPDKGKFCTYSDTVNARSSLYIMRSCEAVGWRGGEAGDDLNTLREDVAKWVKETGGKALVEIKHIPIKNGKRAGETWDKVNSIRKASRPLKQGSASALADAREAMRLAREAVGDDSAGDNGNAHVPPPSNNNPPPISDEDIPF